MFTYIFWYNYSKTVLKLSFCKVSKFAYCSKIRTVLIFYSFFHFFILKFVHKVPIFYFFTLNISLRPLNLCTWGHQFSTHLYQGVPQDTTFLRGCPVYILLFIYIKTVITCYLRAKDLFFKKIFKKFPWNLLLVRKGLNVRISQVRPSNIPAK